MNSESQTPLASGGGLATFLSNANVLFEKVGGSRLLADPVYGPRYREHLKFALGGLYERKTLTARIREWQTLLAPSLKSDKPVSAFGKILDFQTAVATLLASVDARRAHIEAALSR